MMGYDENQAKKPFLQSPFYLFFMGLYQHWRTWHMRRKAYSDLQRMSAQQLKDIGLSCADIDNITRQRK
ncbi:DUF1127 domain-containing protein [Obesumbacterium proteus]|jgi:uncharacterized protein YjiS (DUF1127 family)|uniref:YjiS-like domain-containing protein n=1 Tax=Obesumbacterium proteus ATCC 12841 TaxID=1354268 RepID=A0AA91EGF9_9GAMM|nr:DUF1127 domain-containing protein [Obesumbacterium proteus]MCE9885199.1 DUF1127 domain-containing protein [Obesumbacterium proteus]MCE9917411.1 DUF1127 domain-containing protein [Obesumbacterium proteus]MCE9931287.1 DUF1127 domain-containing protein [Obesumbacterium proteus]MCG2878633.1 DUF1127 domain-containing protein [Obesumbacterium proteus]OAT57777.1 hypothetical protein M993_03521 [Obesumbacterium proteus ATCC 12841]